MPENGSVEIPYGYCHCGCGQQTKVSTVNKSAKGYVVGKPQKYMVGHYSRRERPTYLREGEKYCKSCDQWKALDGFYPQAGYKCKDCQNKQNISVRRKNRSENPEQSDRAHSLWARYRLRVSDFDAMFSAQEGLCSLCRRRCATVVDHDHQTGKVRSLLCHGCNGALGTFYDDPVMLRKAAEYIEGHRKAALEEEAQIALQI